MRIRIVAAAIVGLAAGGAFRAPLLGQESAKTVWDGVFTDDQAKRGEGLFTQNCASCHGAQLTGMDEAPTLSGGTFTSNWDDLSVGDLFQRIKLTMPGDDPGRLSSQETADVLAYLLSFNKFPSGQTELPNQPDILKGIKIKANKP